MTKNRSIDFFETQFLSQTAVGELTLNPFEVLALPYIFGRVLDLGCGLGNLSVEAARRGCSVIALDGSPTAIAHIRQVADSEHLSIDVEQIDLSTYRITDSFETIVAIGLLMFFPKRRAVELLEDIAAHVQRGGHAIINMLVQGTTYLDMFEPDQYCLFSEDELVKHFAAWNILEFRCHRFAAPGDTVKAFATIVSQRK